MMIPFHEAWLSSKGEVFSDGDGHYDIGRKIIKEQDPESYTKLRLDMGDFSEDRIDFVYDYMWSRGYGRLVGRQWAKDITIGTSKDYPQYKANLIAKAKKVAKNNEEVKELLWEDTGRTLWSREDTI
jgi:hypothetical protein